ncbi:MAG: hypothetical protein PHX09_01785 [Clostridia bacterium]|nr:hypothetical protein [Clostridia bacterium]MDD4685978.1 hypothetical protein [Clostridia bacterium]
MGNIKAFVKSNKSKKKKSKKESWFIFVIIMLSGLLAFSVFLVYSNVFYKSNFEKIGQKMLGETIKLYVEDRGSFSQALSFQGSTLPNFDIRQEGYLYVKDNQENCVARVKMFVYNSLNEEPSLLNGVLTTDWVLGEDNYYYYKYVLTESVSFKFLHSIKMPSDEFNLHSSEFYSIVVSVETLPYTSDFEGIWNTIFLE